MSAWFSSKVKHSEAVRVRLNEAADRLECGDITALAEVYTVFASGDKSLTARGGRAVREFLKVYDLQQMMRLGERFRQYTSMEWSIHWSNISLKRVKHHFETEQDYYSALILGCFHPNGYFREQCIVELAEEPNSLPYLILRMNDWVSNVRQTANRLVSEHIGACGIGELLEAAQALSKVRRSVRREDGDVRRVERELQAQVKKALSALPLDERGLSPQLLQLIAGYGLEARRSSYEILFSAPLLGRNAAEALLRREKQGWCKCYIFSRIAEMYDLPDGWIDRYLTSRSSAIRRKALEYQYEKRKDAWPGLEGMLLDKSRGVREYAGFILTRHRNFALPDFYRTHLTDEEPVAAILGLGETGDEEDAELLLQFLKRPEERIAASALRVLGKFLGTTGGELFWSSLFDERTAVVKAAYQALTKNRILCGAERIYREFEQRTAENKDGYVRERLLRLLLREKSWDRLPYLLRLYRLLPELAHREEEKQEFYRKMRDPVLGKIKSRALYVRITEEQNRLIEEELERSRGILEEALIEEIYFDLKRVVQR